MGADVAPPDSARMEREQRNYPSRADIRARSHMITMRALRRSQVQSMGMQRHHKSFFEKYWIEMLVGVVVIVGIVLFVIFGLPALKKPP